MLNLTWKDKVAGHGMPVGAEVIRKEWVYWAEKLAEPFRSAYLAVASNPNVALWCDRLGEWRTEPWDNRSGRVTLAGDAAHPMTYRKLHLLLCPGASLPESSRIKSCALLLRLITMKSRPWPRPQQRHPRRQKSLRCTRCPLQGRQTAARSLGGI